MDKNQLPDIYEFGELADSAETDQEFLSIPFDSKWFVLPKEKLTTTEINLLSALFLEKSSLQVNIDKHPWYGFLFSGKPIENVTGSYRIIQFEIINAPNVAEKKEWLKAFTSMFNIISDSFFLTDSYGLLVEKKEDNSYTLEELEGILLTLESDFSCKAKAFIGSFLNISDGFPRFFQEEKAIFISEAPSIKGQSVFALPQVALHYFTKDAIQTSLIMQIFRKKLSIDTEMTEIIEILWRNQGNISSTAKELFMHRNTLQYRIERFHEATGLSLKSMDDLVLSYLLVSQ